MVVVFTLGCGGCETNLEVPGLNLKDIARGEKPKITLVQNQEIKALTPATIPFMFPSGYVVGLKSEDPAVAEIRYKNNDALSQTAWIAGKSPGVTRVFIVNAFSLRNPRATFPEIATEKSARYFSVEVIPSAAR